MKYRTINRKSVKLTAFLFVFLLLLGLVCLYDFYCWEIVYHGKTFKETVESIYDGLYVGSAQELMCGIGSIVLSFVSLRCFFGFLGRVRHCKDIVRNGCKLNGKITRAYYIRQTAGRKEINGGTHYLEIAFFDRNGKARRFITQPYDGNPNLYLKSTKVTVCECDGEFCEATFETKGLFEDFFKIELFVKNELIEVNEVSVGKMRDILSGIKTGRVIR